MGKFLILVVLFAVVTYMVVWTVMRRRAAGTAGQGPALGRRTPPAKQVAPDDDEDFLRWLERKQRSAKPGPEEPPAEHPDAGSDPKPDPAKDPERDPDAD